MTMAIETTFSSNSGWGCVQLYKQPVEKCFFFLIQKIKLFLHTASLRSRLGNYINCTGMTVLSTCFCEKPYSGRIPSAAIELCCCYGQLKFSNECKTRSQGYWRFWNCYTPLRNNRILYRACSITLNINKKTFTWDFQDISFPVQKTAERGVPTVLNTLEPLDHRVKEQLQC